MRKIKILGSGKQASPNNKVAFEPGDIPKVQLDNFETLTNPPFKPKLELIEADPHDPPTMDAQTDKNIETEGDDPNRPSASDIASKAPEYENSNPVEVHDPPHEHEHVKQGELERIKAEFSNKFARASRLFDIKIAAGIEEEINRNAFVHSTADSDITVEELDQKIADSEAFLGQIQTSKKVASPVIPTGFSGGPKKESLFNDDLEMILLAGE